MKKYPLFILTLITAVLAHAQYHIDSTFNGTGTNEFTQYAGNIVNGKKVAYAADNNLVVAGRWNTNLTVWKYKQDGDLDLTFGTNGISYFDLSVFNADIWVIVKDLEIQDNGKIVVLADAFLYSSNFDYSQSSIVLARFNSDGSPDLSFNSTGLLITKPNSNFNYDSRCLDIDDATSQIYVGGTVTEYGSFSCPFGTGAWFVANFTDSGAYDLTFNSSGYVQETADDLAQGFFTPQTPMSVVLDVKALPNDRLSFAGALNNMDHAMFTARLNADGTYDNSYATAGRKALQDADYQFPSNGLCWATILQDGSSLFHVNMTSATNADSVNFVVYKFTNTGNPDLTFGTNGIRTFSELVYGMLRMITDTNNRLIYSWYNKPLGAEQYVNFRRLMPDGSDDAAFGYQGYYEHLPVANETYFSGSYVEDLAINPENNDLTIIAYRSASYVPNGSFRILNYHVDLINDNLSVQTLPDNENTFIYPNPTDGRVSVETPVSGKFSLVQANGALVLNGNLGAGNNSFDWSEEVDNGLYFLQIETESGQHFALKISVEK